MAHSAFCRITAPDRLPSYAAYKAGSAPSRNEVEQIGFRLAALQKLDKVHGIDVDGDFPYEKMASWAEKNGMADRLAATRKMIDALVGDITERQKMHALGGVLKHINSAQYLKTSNFFYGDAMRYGHGDDLLPRLIQRPARYVNANSHCRHGASLVAGQSTAVSPATTIEGLDVAAGVSTFRPRACP